MSAVSETIVREYFELHGFLVRQHRKFVAPNRNAEDEDDIDFYVLNPQPQRRPAEAPRRLCCRPPARPEARMHEMLVVRGKIVEVANKCYQRISLKVRDCSLYG